MIIFVNGFDYTGEALDNMLRWTGGLPKGYGYKETPSPLGMKTVIKGRYPKLMHGWYVKQCRWMEKVEDGTVFH